MDDYSNDEVSPELYAAPQALDETEVTQGLQVAPQNTPMVPREKVPTEMQLTPRGQPYLIQDLIYLVRIVITHI